MGARYGRFPHEVLDALPFRIIARCYLLILREQERQRIHTERVHGCERDTPDWLEDDDVEPDDELPPELQTPVPEGCVKAILPGVGPKVVRKDSEEYRQLFGG